MPARKVPSPEAAAARRYVDAVDLVRKLRREWKRLGEPVTTVGSMDQLIAHPLVKMIRDAERDVERLEAAMRPRHRGPVPSAVPNSGGERPALSLVGLGNSN
jgi:hypothetical protein